MIPYEKSEKLATFRKDFHYELKKTQVVSNVARNSMVFPNNEQPKPRESPVRLSIGPSPRRHVLIHQPSSSKEQLQVEDQAQRVRNAVQMAKMPLRFKDQEELYQSRVETHWQKTTRLL